MKNLKDVLSHYKGKKAMVNNKESQLHGLLVVDIQPKIPADRAISVIEGVTDELLILNYYDAKELHYIPLDKIIKVTVILRESSRE
jgi:hypothetical protein